MATLWLILNSEFLILYFGFPKRPVLWNVGPRILPPYHLQFASLDECFQLGQCCVAAALAHVLRLRALDATVGGEELRQALLDDGIGELLGASGASAHDDGSAHGVLQLGAGAEHDTAHLNVLARDMILLALVLAGEGQTEGAYVVYLHAVAVEQGIADALAHGLQHGQHVRLGDAAGVVDVLGYLGGADDLAAHDAHGHRGVLLRGLALKVVSHM